MDDVSTVKLSPRELYCLVTVSPKSVTPAIAAIAVSATVVAYSADVAAVSDETIRFNQTM